ncbi:MAG: RnfABCDGE type electron transport complex subunit G [Nanoarchaeota archaeon]
MEIKNKLKNIMVLIIILSISLLLLHNINKLTNPIIQEKKDEIFKEELLSIFDSFDSFNEKIIHDKNNNKKNTIFEIIKNNEIIGYAITEYKYGYQSEIGVLVGFNKNKTIKKIKIIEQMETPGIGSKILDKNFLNQFSNKKKEEIKLKKNDGKIDAVTSATISSEAVVNSVKEAFNDYLSYINE